MSNKHLQLLHLAQDKNSDSNPSILLDQGANPNIRDPFFHNWTPLHYAVFLNKENFALQLLKDPKINAQLLDSDGFSALYWASKKSTGKVITALLNCGCDPNERDMHGMTALFAAVASNKKENVSALLTSSSLNINQVNQFGGSALHHTAFATDNICIADMLVSCGANLFLYDYEDQTPLHVAKRRRRNQLFKYFKLKMKQQNPNWKCNVEWNIKEEPNTATCSTSTDTTDAGITDNDIADATSSDDNDEKKKDDVKIYNNPSPFIRPQPFNYSNSNSMVDDDFSKLAPADFSKLTPADLNKLPSTNLNNHSNNSNNSSHSSSSGSYRIRRRRAQSLSPNNPSSVPAAVSPWQLERSKKMKRIQANRLAITLKIEQSGLSNDARAILMEQQYVFKYEQEVFMESMQHEYDKLQYQLNHFMNLNKDLIRNNNHLQSEISKLRREYSNSKNINYFSLKPHKINQNKINNKKYDNIKLKHKKEFKKWFKKEIGITFIEYYPLFVRAGFDDLRTIKHINHDQDLRDLGILKKGHRVHILDKIEDYRLKYHQINHDVIAKPNTNIDHSSPSIRNNNDNQIVFPLPPIFPVEGSNKTQL